MEITEKTEIQFECICQNGQLGEGRSEYTDSPYDPIDVNKLILDKINTDNNYKVTITVESIN